MFEISKFIKANLNVLLTIFWNIKIHSKILSSRICKEKISLYPWTHLEIFFLKEIIQKNIYQMNINKKIQEVFF